MTNNSVFAVAVLAASLAGCGSVSKSDVQTASVAVSPVDLVRNGVLPGYDSTTVGKAFEGTFQDPKWSSFVTPKGQTVVQFDGTVKGSELHGIPIRPTTIASKCGDDLYAPNIHECEDNMTLPVSFQFVLSADKSTFELGHVDDLFDNDQTRALTIIYR